MAKPVVVGIIPARGGSIGVPRKNIRPLAGKPLIAYTVEAAKQAQNLDRVIVSTDDPEIADVARRYGAEIPFMRPKEFSQADTLDWPVFQHALQTLEQMEHYIPDIVVHLRPTNPCRTTAQIESGIRLMIAHPEADSVRSVSTPAQNPFKMWKEEGGRLVPLLASKLAEAYNQPRQKLPPVWWQNGYVDVAWRKTILEKKSMTGDHIIPLVLEDTPWVDIDNLESFRAAEIYFERFIVPSAAGKSA
jgi:CMP-N,N'-diacetyllegionaminic acid synthase